MLSEPSLTMPKDSNCFPSGFTTSLSSIRTTGSEGVIFFHSLEIRNGNRGRDSFFKMLGKAVHGINLLGRLMELVDDVGEQTAFGCKDSVNHIRNKFAVRSAEALREILLVKVKIFLFRR